ncbi:YiiD C-terminal domain-containing protein [Sedimenticola selenatireducens]|jgi:thioesterase domain-containing protein|uniref:Thioesterase n=1 Tax=Sedimenticola selenatireducens TaxID=191960 RepID=A0A558DT00_9GAMM|nr:YiiD C-terminal domain-containing protein [Sedimenticola selenatireducens]TVO76724.1 thioesterase [Sedimenticola selenatireducens]TVT64167.1 MAG: thioesterase [Sedimenticola selenatireducens]
MKQRLALLEETLHREVPLTRTMGVRVEEHDGRELVFLADFEPNINIHGTAFGGSLYSICAVVCWGMLHLKYEDAGLQAHSVLGDAKISYRLPVRGEIMARCRLPEDGSFETFIEHLRAGKRSRIELTAEILVNKGVAVKFVGSYSATL